MRGGGTGKGKPKGFKAPKTLEKEAIRAHIRARVAAELDPLLDAQIANAIGLKYLVTRDKHNGKFIKVSEAMAKVEENQETIEVWEKDPSVQAFTDLINRAADKPAEQEQKLVITATVTLPERIKQGRARVKSLKP